MKKTSEKQTEEPIRNLLSFDWAAKTILRQKENHEILEGLLTVLLGEEIRIVELLESESNPEYEKAKFNRVDIKAKDAKGELMLVEIQFRREIHYMQRILFSTSKAVVEHVQKGDVYRNIRKIYSINILYFSLGVGDDYLYRGYTSFTGVNNHQRLKVSLKDKNLFRNVDTSEIFPEYFLLRVNAFKGEPRNHLEEWMRYLQEGLISPDTTAPGLKAAYDKLCMLNLSEKERYAYDRFAYDLIYQQDIVDTYNFEGYVKGFAKGEKQGMEKGEKKGLKKGRKAGIEEGLEKGREEGEAIGLEKGEAIGLEKGEKKKAFEIARQLKQTELSFMQIAQVTGLSLEEIEEL